MASRPNAQRQSGQAGAGSGMPRVARPAAAPVLWSMLIRLPDDRTQAGQLQLRDRGGRLVFFCPCLGRSAGIFDAVTGTAARLRAAATTNVPASKPAGTVRRDRLAYRGDTPLGDYAPTFVTTLARPITGIGNLWVGLDPVAGEALAAEQAGRRGLGIHGGRGETLRPTHGCIRLKDSDMEGLAAAAGRNRFVVSIVSQGAAR